MFKDILIPMVMGEIPEAAVRTACAIAGRYEAHVGALVGISMVTPNAAAWAYYPEGLYATLKETAEATAAAMGKRVEARLARETVAHEVRRCTSIWLTTTEMTTVSVRYADLIVMGRSDFASDAEQRLFDGLLPGAGRPLLLVPNATRTNAPFEHVVVAWKSSREAARALHDALPFLQQARSVDVLVVDEGHHPEAEPDSNEERLCRHLLGHGVRANLVRRDNRDMPSGERILDYAAESRAQLVVAGGYSHARSFEYVFGGVTKTLFERAMLPVLFSH